MNHLELGILEECPEVTTSVPECHVNGMWEGVGRASGGFWLVSLFPPPILEWHSDVLSCCLSSWATEPGTNYCIYGSGWYQADAINESPWAQYPWGECLVPGLRSGARQSCASSTPWWWASGSPRWTSLALAKPRRVEMKKMYQWPLFKI
jgi:hypothetical protein